MSNDKTSENLVRRKPKGSWARTILPGLVGNNKNETKQRVKLKIRRKRYGVRTQKEEEKNDTNKVIKS